MQKTRNNVCFQLNVYAVDEGVPPKQSGPQVVTIRVIRNKNSPVFQNEPYVRNINQDAQPGTGVLNMRARDADTRVSQIEATMVLEFNA